MEVGRKEDLSSPLRILEECIHLDPLRQLVLIKFLPSDVNELVCRFSVDLLGPWVIGCDKAARRWI